MITKATLRLIAVLIMTIPSVFTTGPVEKPPSSRDLQPDGGPGDYVLAQMYDQGSVHADQTNEPSVAPAGGSIIETWNVHAAVSADGGSSWSYRDPALIFGSENGLVVGYQMVHFDPVTNMIFWSILYAPP